MRPGKYPSDDMEDMAGFGITAHRTWWANAAGSAGLFAGHNPKELTCSVMAIVCNCIDSYALTWSYILWWLQKIISSVTIMSDSTFACFHSPEQKDPFPKLASVLVRGHTSPAAHPKVGLNNDWSWMTRCWLEWSGFIPNSSLQKSQSKCSKSTNSELSIYSVHDLWWIFTFHYCIV